MGQSTWSVASAGTTNTGGSASPVPSDMSDTAKTPKERLGPILEGALHQGAKLHLKGGRSSKAISRYFFSKSWQVNILGVYSPFPFITLRQINAKFNGVVDDIQYTFVPK